MIRMWLDTFGTWIPRTCSCLHGIWRKSMVDFLSLICKAEHIHGFSVMVLDSHVSIIGSYIPELISTFFPTFWIARWFGEVKYSPISQILAFFSKLFLEQIGIIISSLVWNIFFVYHCVCLSLPGLPNRKSGGSKKCKHRSSGMFGRPARAKTQHFPEVS